MAVSDGLQCLSIRACNYIEDSQLAIVVFRVLKVNCCTANVVTAMAYRSNSSCGVESKRVFFFSLIVHTQGKEAETYQNKQEVGS